MKTIDELYKEYFSDFEIEYNPSGMLYYISNGVKAVAMSSDVITTQGTEYRNYTHETHCSYHTDNWTEDSYRLPKPPYCDCLYTIEICDHESMFRHMREILVEAEQ